MDKRRPVKRLIYESTPGSGQAQAITKPSDLEHLLWVASRGQLGNRNVGVMWMLFGSGLRINEVAQLKVSDIYWKEDRTLCNSFVIPASYTKTNKSRLAYLLAKAQRAAITSWEQQRIDEGIFVEEFNGKTVLKYDSPLFLSKHGKGWRHLSFNAKKYITDSGEEKTTLVCASLENLVRNIIKSAGFQDGSSHSGRRSLATIMDRKGFDLNLIQQLLGHDNPEMTVLYIDPWMKRIETAFEKTMKNVRVPEYK